MPRTPHSRDLRRLLPAGLLLAAWPPALWAGHDIDALVAPVLEPTIEARHYLHQNPELSNRETETAKFIAAYLNELEFEVQTGLAGTGVVGILRGGKRGPVVAARADIDGLPVVEDTDLPFKSTVRTTFLGQEVGVAHACGHDIHTSVLLGTASALAQMRDELPGTIKFIFQPAEEGAPPGERGGADVMIEDGVLESPRPEAIFALHTKPDLDVGEIGFRPGPMMASADRFEITVSGAQSHGAWPHLGVDPVVLASQAVLAFQTIPSRSLDPLQPAVVSVGVVRGGQRFNIIPGSVELMGTVRTFDVGVQDKIERRMSEIMDGLTQAAGASYALNYVRVTPFTSNDAALTQWAGTQLAQITPAEALLEVAQVMGAEDFAYFANEIPGFYFWLGVRAPGTESGGLHTPTYRADDGAILVGMRAMTQLLLKYLETGGPR